MTGARHTGPADGTGPAERRGPDPALVEAGALHAYRGTTNSRQTCERIAALVLSAPEVSERLAGAGQVVVDADRLGIVLRRAQNNRARAGHTVNYWNDLHDAFRSLNDALAESDEASS